MDRNETALFVTHVLSFYERKFTIYKLWSALNPLNDMGQERKLLQVF